MSTSSSSIQKRFKYDVFRSLSLIIFPCLIFSSSWCLEELVKILECQKMTGHTAYPVFYDVEPTQVRKQSSAFGEAFARHRNYEAAGKWREALREAADQTGWDLNIFHGHKAKFINKIAQGISLELRTIISGFDDKLVGMETRVRDVVSYLNMRFDEAHKMWIKGMGMAGKFQKLRSKAKSFVRNVRAVLKPSKFGLKNLGIMPIHMLLYSIAYSNNSSAPKILVSTPVSSIQNSFKYDVFLSFRGLDTRKNFVDHLYHALKDKGIYTYKDDEKIQRGKRISDDLFKSIEDSKFYIIVFSKNYASSSWCLEELVKIMECQKMTEHTAYPVFYDVEPTEVRKQSGAVGEAFAKHEKEVRNQSWAIRILFFMNNKKTILKKWKGALKEAANLAGWELKNTLDGHEAKFINKIVQGISLELRTVIFGFDDKLVDMETRVRNVVSYLNMRFDEAHMMWIKGMGMAGMFQKLHSKAKSFVRNVRAVLKPSKFGLRNLGIMPIHMLLYSIVSSNNSSASKILVSPPVSSIQNNFKYDVFLSFRGLDTRKNFVDHLYHALKDKGIHTYKDDVKIQKGKRISDDLFKSIEDSKFYIIIFSKNYASSSWCLEELVKIMECHKMTEHTAYPVFYDVEPTEVRKQSGAVGEAFAKHEKELNYLEKPLPPAPELSAGLQCCSVTYLQLILLGLSKGSKDKMIVGLMLNDHGSQKSNETGKSHANDML
ncbi:Toll/interleukin-1 receptor domain-containing protein [Tanacetum coccineum]